MKKLIALLLALVMVLGLVACGGTENPAADAPADTPADAPADNTPADTPADAPADAPAAPAADGEVEVVKYFCNVGAYLNVLQEEIDKWNEGEGKEAGVYIDLTSEIQNSSTVFEAQMEAGNYFDLADGFGSKAASYYFMGWVTDLESIDDPEIQALIDSYRDYMIPGMTTMGDGATIAVPLEVRPIKMAVNLDLFEKNNLELPKTLDEMVECARVITENGGGTEFGFGGSTWTAMYRRLLMKTAMSSVETGWWDPNTGTYSFDQFEKPITALKTMYENGWVVGLDDLGIDEIRAQFAAGNVGMFPAPSYDISVYTNQFPAECNWTIIDMPTYDGTMHYKGSYIAVANVSIIAPAYDNASPEHQAAVRKAFLFLSSDELYGAIYAHGGMIPVKPEIIANTEVLVDVPQWELMADLTNYAQIFVYPDSILPLEGDNYATVFSSYVHGDVEWDEAVADLNERYNAAWQVAVEDPDIDTSLYLYSYSHNLD